MLITANYQKPINTFSDFGQNRNFQGFYLFNVNKKLTTKDKFKIAACSAMGTAVPLAYLMTKHKIPYTKVKYTVKEMIMLSAGSIAGGITGGYIVDKDASLKHKLQEGNFQFFNALIPTLLINPILKLCNKVKILNNNKAKALTLLGGILGGMFIGEKISSKINNAALCDRKRKVKPIDLLSNIDVISGALLIAKFPLIKKLGVEKFLPLVYLWTGYQSGKMQ